MILDVSKPMDLSEDSPPLSAELFVQCFRVVPCIRDQSKKEVIKVPDGSDGQGIEAAALTYRCLDRQGDGQGLLQTGFTTVGLNLLFRDIVKVYLDQCDIQVQLTGGKGTR